MAEKYNASNISVEQILNFIKSGEIAIPEIQRPFVWKPKQVRDLIDSFYAGYPAGYLIISQSPDIRLKNGRLSEGKKIMIDGQQRMTALMTAIVGDEIIDANFKRKRIKISFNPFAAEDEERFKVQDNAILKDKRWIADIAVVFSSGFDSFSFIQEYCKKNSEVNPSELNSKIMQLLDIKNRQIGVITLNKELTIDEVTEVFIRINSQGTKLNQSDFVMSKIAANTKYSGNVLRKAIDYFSHLAIQPDWYAEMEKDRDFIETDFAQKLSWLKNDKEEIYDPDYGDILRVALMCKFRRGKMKDLVSLLSGRDFETRDYKEEIAEDSFKKLTEGVLEFMSGYSFRQFVLAIKSAGFISKKLINSQMTLNFAYALYLLLSRDDSVEKGQIKRLVAKWYVLSTLTGRYISSPETVMDRDIRRIKEKGFSVFFKEVEDAELSDAFWEVGLVQNLDTSAINSPYFNVFTASQIRATNKSLFTSGMKVEDLVQVMGDIHHIFPRAYLKKNGIKERSKYNQIANYTYLDTQTNISIGEAAPCDYFRKVVEQCRTGKLEIGDICDEDVLRENLKENCIPCDIEKMDVSTYDEFLLNRRVLMAQKIKKYYESL